MATLRINAHREEYSTTAILQWTLLLLLVCFICVPQPNVVFAQSEASALEQERATTERFLQVLMRRPRPGTALDRVYGFHVRHDSLDQFLESLDVPEDEEQSGAKAFILGLVELQRGQQAAAIEALLKAETRLPEDAACSYYLGKAYLAVGQTERAAEAMERAIDRKPSRTEALPIYTELGRIYGRAGLTEESLSVWTRLEEVFPGDDRVAARIAQTLVDEGNLEEALQRYEQLATSARRDEDKIKFAVEAAEIRRRLGEAEQATRDLETILARLRPGSWLYNDVRNRIEAGFLESGDANALADYYLKQLESQSDDLELRTRLGRILVSAGRIEEAEQILAEAVTLAPQNQGVRLALIDVLVNKSDFAGAISQFAELVEQDPENPDYLLRWGRLLLDEPGKPIEARRDAAARIWQRLAEARPDDAVTLSQIADRMRSIDRNEDAIALYRQAIQADPTSPQYREYLGEFLHRVDRTDDAIETWESIAGGDRRNRESLVRLAEVFSTFSMPERALETWKQAAERDLTFAQELRFADALRRAEDYEEALKRLNAAELIAETPEEREQLLKDRIRTYSEAGTLNEQIAKLAQEPASLDVSIKLALMYEAAGQPIESTRAINQALELAPDSVAVMSIAADIAEQQDRLGDAIELLKKLTTADPRFQSNYLQRIAGLHLDLGEIDAALQTCDRLIDFNPASPESYQFYARTALSIGRDEKAFDALRRAMNVARRDNGPRNMLASAYAERYRTEEAIELYWQSFEIERDLEGKLSLINRLAPLYERKGESEVLIERLKEQGTRNNETRTTQMLIAEAYQSVDNYGAAQEAILPLLAASPQDVELLQALVLYADQANDTVRAAEYQQQIVSLADTPENRFHLLQLQVDAGLVDTAEAIATRVSLTADPVRLGYLIRSSARRGDLELAIGLCREALTRDDTLWDVKLFLAQALLHKRGLDAKAAYNEAFELITQLQQSSYPPDTVPPTASKPSQTRLPSGMTQQLSSPALWGNISYSLCQTYQVGRYSNQIYQTTFRTNVVEPTNFAHAQFLAGALEFIYVAKTNSGDELQAQAVELFKNKYDLPPLDQVDDPYDILKFNAFRGLLQTLTNGAQTAVVLNAKEADDWTWRLAELDPDLGSQAVMQKMLSRVFQQAAPGGSPPPEPEPLSDERLEILENVCQAMNKPTFGLPSYYPSIYRDLFETVVAHELNRAGFPERAAQFTHPDPGEDASFDELMSYTFSQLALRDVGEEAERELMERLVKAVRKSSANQQVSASTLQQNLQILTSGVTRLRSADFVDRYHEAILELSLANTAPSGTRSSSLSNGTTSVHVRTPQGHYVSLTLETPLSSRLFDSATVNQLFNVVQQLKKEPPQGLGVETLPAKVVAQLNKTPADATPEEIKTRRCLLAFNDWWNKQPEACYKKLQALCAEYPNDIDLLIEQARLASELSQPRKALEILDSFTPLDSDMLTRKEMAAMNLAAELGNVERAVVAAERLYGLRMDPHVRLALIDQLRRLGMEEKATAMLRRLRGRGRSHDASTTLNIARSFLASGDKQTAAEVAYSLLKQLSRGRGQQNNVEHYRSQAYQLLLGAGRLEGLIETAERRLKATPTSDDLKTELAQLYAAAGREEDASKLWDELSDGDSVDPHLLIQRAQTLSRAGKHEAALDTFLKAFELSPQLVGNSIYEMQRAAEECKQFDKVYETFLKIDVSKIPSYRIGELLRWRYDNEVSEYEKKLVAHFLDEGNAEVLRQVMQAIPAGQHAEYPEIKKTLQKQLCTPAAFKDTGANFWSVYSYSSGGIANGVLEPVLTMLVSDEETREKFLEVAEEAIQEDSQKLTAELLIALVSLATEDDQTEAIESLKNVTSTLNTQMEQNSSIASNQSSAGINWSLLWQAGQVLEESVVGEKHPEIIVAFYEAAAASRGQREFEYSPKRRLVDAYHSSGQPAKARELLVTAFKQTNNAQQHIHNPGYGDYQDLRVWKSLAESFVKLGYPIDAIIIYQHGLSAPDRFARAKRWGGAPTQSTYTQALAQARQQVTSEQAIAHLYRLKSSEENAQLISSSLLPLSAHMIRNGEFRSSFGTAIQYAQQEESGRKALREYESTLQKSDDRNTPAWAVTGVRLLLAAIAKPAQAAELKTQLFEELPSLEDEEAAQRASTQYHELLGLAEVAHLLQNRPQEDAKQSGRELLEYLVELADREQDTETLLALSSLSGDGNDAAEAILASLENRTETSQTIGASDFDSCLQIAEQAARQKNVELSTRALRVALRNGPPLRRITSKGNAFAVTNSPSSSSVSDSQDQQLEQLCIRLNDIIDLYSTAVGVQLGTTAVDNSAAPETLSQRQEQLKHIYTALEAAILPSAREDEVFAYAVPIVSPRSYDQTNTDELQIRSLLVALTRVAEQISKSEELAERAETRLRSGSKSLADESLLIHIAIASKSNELLTRAIEEFSQAADPMLPAATDENPAVQAGASITTAVQQESFRKSELLNEILLGLWPVLNQQELSGEQRASLFGLLERVLTLVESDHYTDRRHHATTTLLRRKLLAHAGRENDKQQFQSIVNKQLASVERYYARYNSQSREANIHAATERLIRDLTADGHVALLAETIRDQLGFLCGAGLDSRSITPSMLCLDVAQLPLEDRYAALRQLSIGNEAQGELMHWGGVVCYELPPPMLQHKTTRLEEIQSLPVCTNEFPVTDTILLLADAAAELGVSEELANELAARSQSPVDEASIAAALVQITSLRASGADTIPDSLLAVVNAVQQQLSDTVPKDNSKDLPIPILEAYLAARLADIAGHSEQAAEMLTDCRTHAVRGQDHELVSALNRRLATRNLVPQETLSEGSPLEHFVPIELPRNTAGRLSELPPLYSFSQENGLHATSGSHLTLFTLKYPVQGSFEFSADIQNGRFADADLAYGGLLFHANGWGKRAQLTGIHRGQVVKLPLETPFKLFGMNRESLQATEETISGAVNDHQFVSDQRVNSYPWLAVVHQLTRKSHIKNIQLTGNVTIPREVNLLSPTMHGWANTTFGRGLPDLHLPIGPEQNARQIKQSRQQTADQLEQGPIEGGWSVYEQMLHYRSRESSNQWDPHSHIQYLRPLLDGETITCSFWWDWGKTELHPAIGRLRIALQRGGARLIWIPVGGDLATATSNVKPNAPDPQTQHIAPENVPIDDAWNTFTMTRNGETVVIQLNDKPLLQLEIDRNARPGLIRQVAHDVKVRSLILTGDWPETLPDNLMAPRGN